MTNLWIDKNGTKKWYNSNGEYHREDGPAIEWTNGSKEWFRNGKRHREDGPGWEGSDGNKAWYIDGNRIK